ncbi:MAG: PDZ domain-containing protein [Gammaproteobacteria bacterium]|nr:PDZ domain-containing protein [Gammaproteobacteria bacterium]
MPLHCRTAATLILPLLVTVGCVSSVPQSAEQRAEEEYQRVQLKMQSIQDHWDRKDRIARLSYPLFVANADLCGSKVKKEIDFQWVTLKDFDEPLERIAGITLGISRHPYVTTVTSGSAAYQAGLRQGDVLIALNGEPLREDKDSLFEGRINGERFYRWQFNRLVRQAFENDPTITVQYRRGDELFDVEFQPATRCSYSVSMVDSTEIMSFSEGNSILVSLALYDFAKSDEDFQTLLAHELAHRVSRHRAGISAGETAAVAADTVVNVLAGIGMLVAAVAGEDPDIDEPIRLFSSENAPKIFKHRHELEADYLGMYMLARAGVDTTQTAEFWKSIPEDSLMRITHQHKDGRIENIVATQQEISKKIDEGNALDPNPDREPIKAAAPAETIAGEEQSEP